MSNFGSWPNYRVRIVRSVGEFLWAAARLSWRVDRLGVPILLPTGFFLYWVESEC